MKTKISLSLAEGLVEQIDQEADREDVARSQMVERILTIWFQMSARKRRQEQLDRDTIAYYESLTPAEAEEHEALAHASGRAARQLKVD
jgi:metal-responsive CopG/Arc/MetJ family transcriptional regulator